MKTRPTIHVVMGGASAEHDISLQTGLSVLQHLDKEKYDTRAVVISKHHEFFLDAGEPSSRTMHELCTPHETRVFDGPYSACTCKKVWDGCDLAFLALHGSYGEDGVLQGYLETLGIPYTGSGVTASACAMNKITSKYIFQHHGLEVPPYKIYGPSYPENTPSAIGNALGFPLFAKCPQSGSSKLMGKANNLEGLQSLLTEFIEYSSEILIEKNIEGREFSCPVLEQEDGALCALPVIEISPEQSSFFDFEAKYTPGACTETVPADIDAALTTRIGDVACKAHRALGCRGISRVDMILCNESLYVLEINTLPGLTSNSLVPKSYKARGGSYSQLLDTIITVADKKRRHV